MYRLCTVDIVTLLVQVCTYRVQYIWTLVHCRVSTVQGVITTDYRVSVVSLLSPHAVVENRPYIHAHPGMRGEKRPRVLRYVNPVL